MHLNLTDDVMEFGKIRHPLLYLGDFVQKSATKMAL